MIHPAPCFLGAFSSRLSGPTKADRTNGLRVEEEQLLLSSLGIHGEVEPHYLFETNPTAGRQVDARDR